MEKRIARNRYWSATEGLPRSVLKTFAFEIPPLEEARHRRSDDYFYGIYFIHGLFLRVIDGQITSE